MAPSSPLPVLERINKYLYSVRRLHHRQPALIPAALVTVALSLCLLAFVSFPSPVYSRVSLSNGGSVRLDGQSISPVKTTVSVPNIPTGANDRRTVQSSHPQAREISSMSDDTAVLSVHAAALLKLQLELERAIIAKRFEECSILRDAMIVVEREAAEGKSSTSSSSESVDDYLTRIKLQVLRDSVAKLNKPAAASEAPDIDSSSDSKDSQPQPQAELQSYEQPRAASNDVEALHARIQLLEDTVRITHKQRVLANRAKRTKTEITFGKIDPKQNKPHVAIASVGSDGDSLSNGVTEFASDDSDTGVVAGIRAQDIHESHDAKGRAFVDDDSDRGHVAGVRAVDGDNHLAHSKPITSGESGRQFIRQRQRSRPSAGESH